MAKKLSEQALIRANRVEKSFKIIKRTCSSIRDLRVFDFLLLTNKAYKVAWVVSDYVTFDKLKIASEF